MKQSTLTTKESLALQAMIRRAGMAAVLDELFLLSQERITAEDPSNIWQEVSDALYEASEGARKVELT
jgi:hypothetical protein